MTVGMPNKYQAPRKERIPIFFRQQKTTSYPDPLLSTRSASVNPNLVRCLAWSPLGNFIATGAGSSSLRIWNPEKSNIKHATDLRGHSGLIDRVAWNPTQEAELASCGMDGIVRFWDVRDKHAIGQVKVGGECINMAWSPDGSEVVVGRKDDHIFRIDRSTLTSMSEHVESRQTNQMAFSYSGKELLVTTGDGHVKILDYPSMEHLHTLVAHTSAAYCIEIAAPATYVAVGGSDALITLWDTTDWVCRRTFDRCQGLVRTLSFSLDGNLLVGGSDDGTGLEIAHVESGEYVYKIETKEPAPILQWSPKDYSLAYAPSGKDETGLKVLGSLGV